VDVPSLPLLGYSMTYEACAWHVNPYLFFEVSGSEKVDAVLMTGEIVLYFISPKWFASGILQKD